MQLPRTAEDLIHDVYNYFSHSAKRQADFEKFQSFAEVELLRPCQTRWLSLHACVSRVIEQWEVLTLYFENVSLNDNLLSSQNNYEIQFGSYIFIFWILFYRSSQASI